MKYKNPNTGNFDTLYVKALDSMPVGTEVDFDGQASDIPVGWEEVEDKLNTSIIQEFTPTNATNYSNYGNCYYYKDGHRVTLHIGVSCSNNEILTIFTLPAEYRPTVTGIVGKGLGAGLSDTSCVFVKENGEIKIYTTSGYVRVDMSWDIFEGGNS